MIPLAYSEKIIFHSEVSAYPSARSVQGHFFFETESITSGMKNGITNGLRAGKHRLLKEVIVSGLISSDSERYSNGIIKGNMISTEKTFLQGLINSDLYT